MDQDGAERARADFAAAGFAEAALVFAENAKDGLEKLEGRFDACFIDLLNSFRSEEIPRRVLALCLERLDPRALLMAGHPLRLGEGLHPDNQPAKTVRDEKH